MTGSRLKSLSCCELLVVALSSTQRLESIGGALRIALDAIVAHQPKPALVSFIAIFAFAASLTPL